MMKRWDIFCKVVDNFGDIGVCWRLAKQLKREHDLEVRLWVDDLATAQRLITSIQLDRPLQVQDAITIGHWNDLTQFNQAADVVIETFGCCLPDSYLKLMLIKQSKWINLEYLSAEDWIQDFHGKPSPQANGLTRYFYFPGFLSNTGGLMRESHLSALQHIGDDHETQPPYDDLLISLFCYPHAPIQSLLQALSRSPLSIYCYIPATTILDQVADYFGQARLLIGDVVSDGHLTVEILPFLSQDEYDKLLSRCDINFVRGEDSWVRAIWAEKPFIWQPYRQDDGTDKTKLDAFLAHFYQDHTHQELITNLHRAWLAAEDLGSLVPRFLLEQACIRAEMENSVNHLKKQQDLATKLVIFCNQL